MTETNYEHITHNNNKILVDAAIRDGEGYDIAGTYPRKVDIEVKPSVTTKMLTINHGLQNKPSAVSLYVKRMKADGAEYYEKIGADIITTDSVIQITFAELPEGIEPDHPGETSPSVSPILLVRSLI